jgi:acetolactate synthase-1/2/3 large subunit
VPTGGSILVDVLRANAVERIFCVPGESYLPVLDALYDVPAIQLITARHEAAAANMAEADGKLTGRPGICLVTRGPGATHASIGVHTARQDSTPMILLVGQVPTGVRGREAFQEVDLARMFGGLAKWAAQVDDVRRIDEFVSRAFAEALSGRPGPVVLALPEDVLHATGDAPEAVMTHGTAAFPAPDDLAHLRTLLAHAERPLAIVGGSGWDDPARASFAAFARHNGIPVATSFRRAGLFDNRDPLYAGMLGVGSDPALHQRVRDADLLLALGTRLGDVTTNGYRLIEAPRPRCRLVHAHADPAELGRVYAADVAIAASPRHLAPALASLEPVDGARWSGWAQAAHRDYRAQLQPTLPGGVLDLAAVVRHLSQTLPEDAIVCNGAGNFAAWLHRFFEVKGRDTQLAPTSGAMGYGLPAAVAAKLRYPARVVVAFLGDGEFMMTSHELATAAQYGAAVVVIIVNNGMLATIRMHQERAYPGRVIGTDLRNPDFVALARAYGAEGTLVQHTREFAPALERALAARVPSVLELRVDPENVSTRATISDLRRQAAASAS